MRAAKEPGPAAWIEAWVEACLPGGAAAACRDPRLEQPALLDKEAAAMTRATPARQREFAAGRAAARSAMAALGMDGHPVPMGPDRAPVWPAELTGSLSHTGTCCVAVLAPATALAGVGLDLEPDAPLEAALTGEICRPREQDWVAGQRDPGSAVRLLFSAKEAFYKCQYPLSGALLGFEDVAISLSPDSETETGTETATGSFQAVFQRAAAPFAAGARLTGRYRRGDGLIVTLVWLRSSPPAPTPSPGPQARSAPSS